jgi:HAD superfamily hydrolase (TIGR01509 family)
MSNPDSSPDSIVIFDCDGVLVDSEVLVIEIEAEILTKAGFALTADEIADRFVGLSYPDMMAALESDFGRPVPPELSPRIQKEALASFPDRLQPVEGIGDLLAASPHRRCVASSSDLSRIQLSLDVTGLARHFDPAHLFSAEMVDRGKPAPDLFLHAAERLGCDPTACLVVEDSPHGVSAARAADMAVVGFVGGGHARPSLTARLAAAGADTVVADPIDLAARLDSWSSPAAG